MQKQSRFLFALILLITINGCAGSDIESEKPKTTSKQTPIETDVSSASPQDSSRAPVVQSAPNPHTSRSESSPPKREKKGAGSPPQASASKAPSLQEPELPELPPEKEKLVSKIAQDEKNKGDFVTQNSGVTTLNRVLLAQQAMWLISGSFSTDFKALEPNLPIETDEYRFEITKGNQSEAVVVAIAKSEKLPSFAGSTVAIPAGIPEIGLCQTKLPSQQAPTPPKIDQGRVQCGNDGVAVNNAKS